MLSDFYRPGVALDFPKGGTQAIVAALVRGVTKHEGSHLHLNTHVAQLLIDEEARRCVGVATADGRRVMARKAVISNADLWSTRKLVDAAVGGGAAGSVRAALAAELQAPTGMYAEARAAAPSNLAAASLAYAERRPATNPNSNPIPNPNPNSSSNPNPNPNRNPNPDQVAPKESLGPYLMGAQLSLADFTWFPTCASWGRCRADVGEM